MLKTLKFEPYPDLLAFDVTDDGLLQAILFSDRWPDAAAFWADPKRPSIFPLLDHIAKQEWPPMENIRSTAIRMAVETTLQNDKLAFGVEPRARLDEFVAQSTIRSLVWPFEIAPKAAASNPTP